MGYHRTHNYWEPTYDGQTEPKDLSDFKWSNLFSNNGPLKQICNWTNFDPDKTAADHAIEETDHNKHFNRRISEKTFQICDFCGNLTNITFTRCIFSKCYWNRSIWKNIKFQECKFEKSSFSFARFRNCQFNDCNFSQIGISGNETEFSNCIIDPERLVNAAYTNTDKQTLLRYRKNPKEQIARLEATKAKLAKQINLNNNSYSDYFYKGIKVATLQAVKSRIASRRYKIKWYNILLLICLMGDYVEFLLWSSLGFLNGWGEKTVRVLLSGLILIFIFAICYWKIGTSPTFTTAFVRSFDVTIIAGYSKISQVTWLELTNLLAGMVWYSIAIPTLMTKLTRTRF